MRSIALLLVCFFYLSIGTNGIIISKKIISTIAIGALIFIVLSLKVNDAYADLEWTNMSWK